MKIFVIAHDGGYEGYSGPIQAFPAKIYALSARPKLGDSLVVLEAPTVECFWIEPLPENADAR